MLYETKGVGNHFKPFGSSVKMPSLYAYTLTRLGDFPDVHLNGCANVAPEAVEDLQREAAVPPPLPP